MVMESAGMYEAFKIENLSLKKEIKDLRNENFMAYTSIRICLMLSIEMKKKNLMHHSLSLIFLIDNVAKKMYCFKH